MVGILVRDAAMAMTGIELARRVPDYLRRRTAARRELDDALPDVDDTVPEVDHILPELDDTLPDCGVPFDKDRVGQCCGDGGHQMDDQMGFQHPEFYLKRETTTSAADAVCRVPSFLHEDGATSSDGALEMTVSIAPFDVHTDGMYSFPTYFRGFQVAHSLEDLCVAPEVTAPSGTDTSFMEGETLCLVVPIRKYPRASKTDDETFAALTCDEAGACVLATLPTVAPLDLRHIHERLVLAEASHAGLELLRQTADLQRLFLEWEGTMVCHAIDPDDDDDDDDHSDPPTVYTFAWAKRVMSSVGALARPVLEHVGGYVTTVGQRLSAINVSAMLSRCFGSMAAISPSHFDLAWLSACDLLVGVLLLDVVVRASKFCWRSLGGGGDEGAADGGKAKPPAPSVDDQSVPEWARMFRADLACAETRMKGENLADLASVHAIFNRGFSDHSRAPERKMKETLKKQKAELKRGFAEQAEALKRKYAADLKAGLAAERAAAASFQAQAEARLRQAITALAREASEGKQQHDVDPPVAAPFHGSALVGGHEETKEEGQTLGKRKQPGRRGLGKGGRMPPPPQPHPSGK
ncbi:expressed unknown protein [Ectocarpus siliculosus]|uniref:Uncharacterized protein n=1 Tax=Ectocarpus siliculosus TaxID=2880 RepID=D8LL46_ECTSI|nr:expressed unknown protein [Ectocarpus siliculosus]|eukprot:CBN79663.1 expressed unknown protein [Ectocarpus siliculosus]